MNITVRQCMIGETKWFRKLEGEYHYMGESHGAGDLVRLVFEEEGRPVALMTWAAACYCLKARDERIGWNPRKSPGMFPRSTPIRARRSSSRKSSGPTGMSRSTTANATTATMKTCLRGGAT